MQRPGAVLQGETRSAVLPVFFFALPIVLSALVWAPLRGCYFWADDFSALQDIANDSTASWVLQPWAGHVLVVRNVVFCLCYRLFGMDAASYFTVVLITHLANVALLFLLVHSLT